MTRNKRRRKHQPLSEHGQMAEMLLPPTPKGCPPYSRVYYESYRGQLFQACTNARHRHCPRTSDRGHEHLYCLCPCHRKDLNHYQKRKLWEALKKEASRKRTRKSGPRTPRLSGQTASFRFVKKLDTVPAGIMAVVHAAIVHLKTGTLTEIAATCETAIRKISKQDPTMQTSIMLHRLMKAGAVEKV